MDLERLKKIVSECGSNNIQIPLKVNPKLDALISSNLTRNGKKITKAEFIRELLYIHFLPEILRSRLFLKASDWYSKGDLAEHPMNFDLNTRIRDLEEIIELAQFAKNCIHSFKDKIISAEAEYIFEIEKFLNRKNNDV